MTIVLDETLVIKLSFKHRLKYNFVYACYLKDHNNAGNEWDMFMHEKHSEYRCESCNMIQLIEYERFIPRAPQYTANMELKGFISSPILYLSPLLMPLIYV